MHKGDIKGSTATIASSGGSFTAGTVIPFFYLRYVGCAFKHLDFACFNVVVRLK
jgi:hypothetical protein